MVNTFWKPSESTQGFLEAIPPWTAISMSPAGRFTTLLPCEAEFHAKRDWRDMGRWGLRSALSTSEVGNMANNRDHPSFCFKSTVVCPPRSHGARNREGWEHVRALSLLFMARRKQEHYLPWKRAITPLRLTHPLTFYSSRTKVSFLSRRHPQVPNVHTAKPAGAWSPLGLSEHL